MGQLHVLEYAEGGAGSRTAGFVQSLAADIAQRCEDRSDTVQQSRTATRVTQTREHHDAMRRRKEADKETEVEE